MRQRCSGHCLRCGVSDLRVVIDWVEVTERVFESVGVPDEFKQGGEKFFVAEYAEI